MNETEEMDALARRLEVISRYCDIAVIDGLTIDLMRSDLDHGIAISQKRQGVSKNRGAKILGRDPRTVSRARSTKKPKQPDKDRPERPRMWMILDALEKGCDTTQAIDGEISLSHITKNDVEVELASLAAQGLVVEYDGKWTVTCQGEKRTMLHAVSPAEQRDKARYTKDLLRTGEGTEARSQSVFSAARFHSMPIGVWLALLPRIRTMNIVPEGQVMTDMEEVARGSGLDRAKSTEEHDSAIIATIHVPSGKGDPPLLMARDAAHTSFLLDPSHLSLSLGKLGPSVQKRIPKELSVILDDYVAIIEQTKKDVDAALRRSKMPRDKNPEMVEVAITATFVKNPQAACSIPSDARRRR